MSNLCKGIDFNKKAHTLSNSSNFNQVDFIIGILSDLEFETTEDFSLEKNGSILGYVDGSGTLNIVAEDLIVAHKDCSSMFSDLDLSYGINTENLDSNKIENMNKMYEGITTDSYNNFIPIDSPIVKDMSYMFYNSIAYKVDLSTFSTTNVTNMSHLFDGDSDLTEVLFSNFVTPNISYMFNGCSSLSTVDLSYFGGIIQNIEHIFDGCTSLTDITMPNATFDSSITTLNGIFDSCTTLNLLTIDSLIIENVADMSSLFENNTTITDITITNSTFTNTVNMKNMFGGCTSLANVNFTSLNLPKVINLSGLFKDCSSLLTFDFTKFTAPLIKDISYMFYNLGNVEYTYIEPLNDILDVKNVENMSHLFDGCIFDFYNLDGFSKWKTPKLKNISYMFANNTSLSDINLSYFDTTNLEDLSNLFDGCTSLTMVNFVPSTLTSKITNLDLMFNGCNALNTIDLSNLDVSNVTNMSYMFDGLSNIETINLTNWDTSKVTDMSYMFYSCGNSNFIELDLSSFSTLSLSNVENMFCNTLLQKIHFSTNSKTNTSNLTNIDKMFGTTSSNGNISELHFKNFGINKITNLDNFFQYIPSVTVVDFSNWDISGLKSINNIFKSINPSVIKLANWDLSKITTLNSMFANCTNLTEIDLSGWNTSSIKDMGSLFSGCSTLSTVDLSHFDLSNVTDMSCLFMDCSLLTKVSLPHNNKGEKLTTINSMFDNCGSLTEIDLSNWNTSSLTDTGYLFSDCNLATNINLTNWDTSKVTDMSYMFENCFSLMNIDGIISTKSVDNMDCTFYYCEDLTLEILISSNPTSYSNTFYNCSGSGDIIVNYEIDCQDTAISMVESGGSIVYLGDVLLPNIIKLTKLQPTSTLIETAEAINQIKTSLDSYKDRLSIILRCKRLEANKNETLEALVDKVYQLSEYVPQSVLCNGKTFNTKIKSFNSFDNSNTIEFLKVDSIEDIKNKKNVQDLSLNKDNSILSYCENNKISIVSDCKIIANKDSDEMFDGCSNLTNINLSNLEIKTLKGKNSINILSEVIKNR